MAEWPSGLGKGLQSPVHGFDSRLRLAVPGDQPLGLIERKLELAWAYLVSPGAGVVESA
jgi:hypothetical protein